MFIKYKDSIIIKFLKYDIFNNLNLYLYLLYIFKFKYQIFIIFFLNNT